MKPSVKQLLKPRARHSHKGDYGRILVVAGSRGLSGACILAATGALRSGAGLVTIGVPETLHLPLARRLLEAMMKPLPETRAGTLSLKAYQPLAQFLKTQDVLAIGPGLSQEKETQALIRKVVQHSSKPMVIDADGLNAFIEKTGLFKKLKAPAILTPHPGEFSRLFSGGKFHSSEERKEAAQLAAQTFHVYVVLKGHETVVAAPDGRIEVNHTGNAGMATGGTGDVLTGVIAAMLGQGLQPFDAARAGVYIHGLAGDLAVKKTGELSLLAGDILDCLPDAFKKTLGR